MILKTLAVIYLFTLLTPQIITKVVTDDDGNTKEIIWLAELLVPPQYVPEVGGATDKAIRNAVLDKESLALKPGSVTGNGLSQMT